MAKLLICGDFSPTKSNEEILSNGRIDECIGKELVSIFNNSDFVALNLETSLTNLVNPKTKRGQINRSLPATVNFLKNANVNLCFLANNHVIDNGNDGVLDTINTLKKNGIECMGVGINREEASKPYIFQYKKQKIAFINLSNVEFNEPENGEIGVNTYNPLFSFDLIKETKSKVDFLIVVFHSGIEYYTYPTPYLQMICRKMIEYGADFVTCQHSHCIGTYEIYNEKTIIYGQGNFLFDDSSKELEKTGLLLQLDTYSGTVQPIPIKKNGALVMLADSETSNEILEKYEGRHNELLKEGFINECFHSYAIAHKREYFNSCVGYNKIYKFINRISGYSLENYIFNKVSKMRIYNMLDSISLREVFTEVMKSYRDEEG
ncbi:MAG: CapA family protein [Erysipelotrichaceae bacterium]|nr:CapA family protein [Erysipelotrichaceae bacterium]